MEIKKNKIKASIFFFLVILRGSRYWNFLRCSYRWCYYFFPASGTQFFTLFDIFYRLVLFFFLYLNGFRVCNLAPTCFRCPIRKVFKTRPPETGRINFRVEILAQNSRVKGSLAVSARTTPPPSPFIDHLTVSPPNPSSPFHSPPYLKIVPIRRFTPCLGCRTTAPP